ncbi:hypothetical protein ABIB94_004180 [Bradyrhizobium sp. JR7.2]|nr:hypothetical protein [Bradyrhizobium barranii]WFT92263.1 hypothetical protein QA633_28420 [Bradyrhizobium barranii]
MKEVSEFDLRQGRRLPMVPKYFDEWARFAIRTWRKLAKSR